MMHYDAMERAFEREMEVLDSQFNDGVLSQDEYNEAVRDLERSMDAEETRYEDERGGY